jgi:hypothetical protein
MANENNFNSGHVILPVAHPSGRIDNIAIPEDVPLSEVHEALSDYYHPMMPQAGPTKEGSLEYSDAFRKAATNAVGASRNFTGNESGFAVDASGQPGKTQTTIGAGGSHNLAIVAPSNAEATLHTHPMKTGADEPSADDIQIAKKMHHTVYVASKGGLFAVDPGGSVSHIFKSADWANQKNPK